MAISGTEATMDYTERENLDSKMDASSYSTAVGENQGMTASTNGFFGIGGTNAYAGISDSFVTNVTKAIDDYIDILNGDLQQIEDNVKATQAFKGTEVVNAVNNLLVAIKQEAQSYTASLQNTENDIIEQVRSIYKSQSEEVGSQMEQDTASLNSYES